MVDEFLSDKVERGSFKIAEKELKLHPKWVFAAINPRDLDELMPESLQISIEEDDGIITNPLLAWKPTPEQWQVLFAEKLVFSLTNEFQDGQLTWINPENESVEVLDLEKCLILCRGHRRGTVATNVVRNPKKFSKVIYDNLSKMPVRVVTCSQETAEHLARDDKDSKGLFSWNVVVIVIKMLMNGFTYQYISKDIPEMLYKAFLDKGDILYTAVSRVPDKLSRDKEIVAKLKNKTDTWIRTMVRFGGLSTTGETPANQLVKWFRYKEDGRPLREGQTNGLLLNLKFGHVQKFFAPALKLIEADASYIPISDIRVTSEKTEETTNRTVAPIGNGMYFVVEGGNAEVRAFFIEQMKFVKFGGPTTKEVKAPTTTQRQSALEKILSTSVKAAAIWNHTGITANLISPYGAGERSISDWEQFAAHLEGVYAVLLEHKDDFKHPAMQKVINAITGPTLHPDIAKETTLKAFQELSDTLTQQSKPVNVPKGKVTSSK